MRDWNIQRKLELQAKDGTFILVTEWSKPRPSPVPGRVVILSDEFEYSAEGKGRIEKMNDHEYRVVVTGEILIDPMESE